MLSSPRVSHRIDENIFIIELCDTDNLNSLTFEDFLLIATYLELANENSSINFTIIQSSGKFFSAGGKFTSVLELAPDSTNNKNQEEADEANTELRKLYTLIGSVATPNVYVTNAFVKHTKPIICSLNGPAIGLSACLVCLCDIVYSMNDSVYLLFPFSSLGFVAEVGSSVTLYDKLGINTTNEHLFFSTKIPFEELNEKIIVKNYNLGKDHDDHIEQTKKFNSKVISDLKLKSKHLSLGSLQEMKKLLSFETNNKLRQAQSLETNSTLPFWINGEPFKRFRELQQKKRRHKL
ncbi:similar to Saccharomyces cerevisiae YOR180C DCI1 Peroxisomal protein [Maudiozyma barnettii]|uniref:Similar to Saccharomyces cerevisiae YOR180C DCI1 Peroxisomal protein n=1 Tax=Maudiozyma barnettii TaxID=61262 RepID=A0A8H2VF25_9SACH|nr:putative dodecenoyl-CoA isomerase DCI1 [Kazachstania barnettii]CAB4254341.1 similar to Saccharomyces cerevisiae YOR180C DCI1 Peroxisomal protein [Kazachstania barnettii]CAD1782193.1 similar to Saccharomyces cerevisiae YOR180C DCI1 Peroxisomal protein [Kazachstania barnettii]